MKCIITESQYDLLMSEELNFKTDDSQSNIIDDFSKQKLANWFDYKSPEISHLTKGDIAFNLNHVMKYYYGQHYKLKRVLVKDDNELVGFLVYSETTPKKENIEKLIDDKTYPIILSTAISPQYRNRGLLTKMFEKAKIQKPFIVHTSQISTPGIWDKFGCKKIKEVGVGGYVEYCK